MRGAAARRAVAILLFLSAWVAVAHDDPADASTANIHVRRDPAHTGERYYHKCINDDLQHSHPHMTDPLTTKVAVNYHPIGGSGRVLQQAQQEAHLRILFDFTYFGPGDEAQRTCLNVGDYINVGATDPNSGWPSPRTAGNTCSATKTDQCWLLCDAQNVYTSQIGTFIKGTLLPAAQTFLQTALQVQPVVGGLSFTDSTVCGYYGGVTIPSQYMSPPGVANTDMVLFVTARPTQGDVIAYAGSCKQDQKGRPIAGQVNFGPNKVSFDTDELAMQISVAIHEMSHALGFQNAKFGQFINMTTVTATGTVNGKPVTKIVTPAVVAKAKEHYGCDSIDGMEIEDAGGSGTAGSHWEKRVFMDEFMTGSSTTTPQYSPMTLALFEDSGWYVVDYSAASRFDWGRGQGCDFLNKKCNLWTGAGYTCSTSMAASCTYNLQAKGYCQLLTYASPLPSYEQYFPANPNQGGYSELADFCPLVRPYSNGDCTSQSSASDQSAYFGETFHPDGKCFTSSALETSLKGQLADENRNVCYRTFCMSATGPLMFLINKSWYPCTAGATVNPSDTGFDGGVQCPDINYVCAGSPTFNSWIAYGSIQPAEGSASGGTVLTITGTNFYAGMGVVVGENACQNIAMVGTDNTTLTCTLAAHPDLLISKDVNVYLTDDQGRGGDGRGVFKITVGASNLLNAGAGLALRGWEWVQQFMKTNWWWAVPVLVALLLALICGCRHKQESNKIVPVAHNPSAARSGAGHHGGGLNGHHGGHGKRSHA